MGNTAFRFMVVKPVKVAINGGYCRADEPSVAHELIPTRMTFMLSCGAQFKAEDRDSHTIRVFIPLGQQVGVSIELPRHYFVRV